MERHLQLNLYNNFRQLFYLSFFIILLSGCTIFRTGVDVANSRDAIQNCEYMGEVYGSAGNSEENEGEVIGAGITALFAKGNMKQQARRLGANTILIKDAKPNSEETTLRGEAYDCSRAEG